MSIRVIAKQTMLDPYRSRYLWVLFGVYGFLFGLIMYIQGEGEVILGNVLANAAFLFIPFIAIASNYNTIANRRQNGSIRTMLSYPHSRRELVFGTAIGRTLITIGTISFGLLVASIVYLVDFGVPAVEPLLRGWLAALLLGVTMTSFTVGISVSSQTTTRAALLSFVSFFIFLSIWKIIVGKIFQYADGFFEFPAQPEWVDLLLYLNPLQAYFAVVGELVPYRTKGVDGFYATEWFGILVLLAWIVLPLLIGNWRFGRSDL